MFGIILKKYQKNEIDPKFLERCLQFLEEYANALRLEATGEYTLIWFDESFCVTHFAPDKSWFPETVDENGKKGHDKKMIKQKGRGKRAIICHAISRNGLLCTYDDSGQPIRNEKEEGTPSVIPNAEWVWKARSNKKDYHCNFDSSTFMMWVDSRLVPAFEAQYPGQKMILILDNAVYHYPFPEGHINVMKKTVSKKDLIKVCELKGIDKITVKRRVIVKQKSGRHSSSVVFNRGKNEEKKRKVKFFNGTHDYEFSRDSFSKRGGLNAPTREELHKAVIEFLEVEDPDYLKNELQQLFDNKEWILLYTPPGKPQWQPIETVWGIVKSFVARNYKYSDQTYERMRSFLIKGFYGDKDTGYRGVTPRRVRELTEICEQRMLKWLQEFVDKNISNLESFKRETSSSNFNMASDFEFDNSLELGEDFVFFPDGEL